MQSDFIFQAVNSSYERVCSPTGLCLIAQTALFGNVNCISAFHRQDTGAICSGTCRSLLDQYIAKCADLVCYDWLIS